MYEKGKEERKMVKGGHIEKRAAIICGNKNEGAARQIGVAQESLSIQEGERGRGLIDRIKE